MDYQEEIKFVCLCERIGEPLYLSPRGHGATKYLYNLPADHLQPYETQAMVELRKLIPSTTSIVEVPVYKPSVPYDLTAIQKAVPRDTFFSEMEEGHLRAADELIRILLSQPTRTDFFNACALCRDQVNPHLWVHSFIKSALKRPDMRGFRLPSVLEIMPDLFIEARPWKEAIKQATLPSRERAIIVINKDFTGTNLDPNHKVAYFMEDLGGNSHHYHWHVVNSFMAPKGSVDRKGEIFYYMHHGMLARYDSERLANGLNRVVPFDIHKDLIEEACFPKLTLQNASLNFSSRQENSILRDFNRTREPGSNLNFLTIADIRAWCDRIIEAIDAGFAIQEGGGRVDLRTEKGIDIVTNMWESNSDTPHRKYYGMPHNYGHSAFGFCHDPDYRYKSGPGVMFLPATSMRDAAFWRWHKYLDLISKRQKDYLPLYTQDNLQWTGIAVNEIHVVRGDDIRLPVALEPVNNLVTHWMQSDIELSRGLDFGRTNLNGLDSVWVRATHLQHLPFIYRIRVVPPGEHIIIQKSENSTLTVPWAQTFREIERDVQSLTRTQAMCSCGWPDHLLLPRGRVDGMPFDLFVMLTNTQIDQVASSRRQLGTLTPKGTCRDSISYCGMIDDKFPDSRPMGYPFDRPAVSDEHSKPDMFLEDFVTPTSNMGSAVVKIFHVDKTLLRGNGAPEVLRKLQVTP
ncbi:Phenoloxidase 2 [Orchesella cincta]|uniref:Phenoloxidase 2 n=1 Tax=Orchesella cincta TaxID=48709 RepID=A0A1D2NC10_ORCCI|nr:Phenoloxidase 2 [Orchesella cincta]